MASGESTLRNFNPGADCLATLDCLRALDVAIDQQRDVVLIRGRGRHGLRSPGRPLYAANSGTTVRLLAGLVAGAGLEATFDGDASLRRRPMERIARPLREMGAEVKTTNGGLPMSVRGGDLTGVEFEAEVPSAQVRSCVMLAALYADGPSRIRVEPPTRDHTERLLRAAGAELRSAPGGWLEVEPLAGDMQSLTGEIPGDASSAATLLIAAAALPGSELTIENTLVNPTRCAYLDVLRRLGAEVEVESRRPALSGAEESADVTVRAAGWGDLSIGSGEVPGLIDELPVLIAAAASVPGARLSLRGAAELRVKESDRLAVLAANLRRMGASVEERSDGIDVVGAELRGIEVETGGDHRIAMAMAVAALRASGKSTFDDPHCVTVSFPDFFDCLERIARR